MKKIYFVTHNPGKVKEFKQILEPKIIVEQINYDYPELRHDDPMDIAKDGAKHCAEKFKKNIVVEDSGLFIAALKDFPGTCSAYTHKRIGLKGILKLMEGVIDRSCKYKSAVAYCEPGKEPIAFLGEEEGTIAKEERGNNGFGHDPIFIPKGYDKTYAELDNTEELKIFRRTAVKKLLKHLSL
ncbi:MAG: RdgB/HAM1 family non-canonical purine NTP pyrophosphatase [Nanoarchaeota archaeon]|nr:RdgB/HAM1 family non-canonical purine NTP pyrophosphatase [Nanoarchaeota archaeon]MBU1705030.1 RdgB/HAM1 family non-canonical purine NTP pyrophosphatase [Nanoarchaeota archaeon]